LVRLKVALNSKHDKGLHALRNNPHRVELLIWLERRARVTDSKLTSGVWCACTANRVFFAVEGGIVGLTVLFACWALGETKGRSLEHVSTAATATTTISSIIHACQCVALMRNSKLTASLADVIMTGR
jgi:hypothetical protein